MSELEQEVGDEPETELEVEHQSADVDDGGGAWLEPWHRAVIVSKTRAGKSTLATVLTSYMTKQTVVFADVKMAYVVHDAIVTRGVAELQAALAMRPRPRRVHFIPINAAEPLVEWNRFFEICFHASHITIELDECVPMPLPATGTPAQGVRYIGQGARQRNGIIACTGRWRGVSLDLKAHANVIVIFPGGLAQDELDDAAKEMGANLEEACVELGIKATRPGRQLRALLDHAAALGPYTCLWYDRDRGVFRCFRLGASLLERAIATEVSPK